MNDNGEVCEVDSSKDYRGDDIAYRDGKVELTDEIIGEVDNLHDFVVCIPGLPDGYGTHLYHKDDKEHQYPVSYIIIY